MVAVHLLCRCSAPIEQKGLFEVGGRVPTICAVLLWSRRDCLR